ncbi:nitrile hydratase (plasmid) [Azospirillum sp. B510]|uniref:NHLP leader peptide family RiPP precursor n=1 Tax=Azospirillum sp. (strain B510) TaxID=137722 RepID=UPI0001C4BC7D|nr:NHLP leader peptide family RiPP precursor [Azospirillum sp. B510]BAI74509.1 nitrile hydratase [Azospirillum sp. B510]
MSNDLAGTPMTRRELEAKIVARAWSDDTFKAKFLADPRAMFEEHLGTRFPEALTMTAHEETPDALHFVIPAKPQIDLDELSDEDLEKVAGGVDLVVTACAVSIVATAAGMLATLSAMQISMYLDLKLNKKPW